MAEEETRQCSTCGTQVPVTEKECPYCGLNLETGEAYETRVRKAKQDRDHKVAPLSTVLMLPVIAFALTVFAGYMYQRQAESSLDSNKSLVQEYVAQLKKVDTLARFGKVSEARELCQQIIDDVENEASDVESDGDEEDGGATKRSLLLSIQSKAEHKLQKLSE